MQRFGSSFLRHTSKFRLALDHAHHLPETYIRRAKSLGAGLGIGLGLQHLFEITLHEDVQSHTSKMTNTELYQWVRDNSSAPRPEFPVSPGILLGAAMYMGLTTLFGAYSLSFLQRSYPPAWPVLWRMAIPLGMYFTFTLAVNTYVITHKYVVKYVTQEEYDEYIQVRDRRPLMQIIEEMKRQDRLDELNGVSDSVSEKTSSEQASEETSDKAHDQSSKQREE